MISQAQDITLFHGREAILGFRAGAQMNLSAHTIAQLQVAGDEIGMRMREKHMPDFEAPLSRIVQILLYVALRIDDRSHAGTFIGDHVRGMRQAAEIILLEDQRRPLPP